VTSSARFLTPAAAARRLGVSSKALRLWEARGLVAPGRTGAGWRAYGPVDMIRAEEVAALRALGLSLGEVGRVLGGEGALLAAALAAHEAALETQLGAIATLIGKVRTSRARLAEGVRPGADELSAIAAAGAAPGLELILPWPWGGEAFTLPPLPRLAWITGPLGSGKTRLALALAEVVPGATFVGLDRLDDGAAAARARIAAEPALARRCTAALGWLADEGAEASDALTALVAAVEAEGTGPLVLDMAEEGLDEGAQQAFAAWLRRRPWGARPLLLLTRSSALLDLAAAEPGEAVLYCPANHSPPMLVAPVRGAAGYEAVATCLGSPAARARTRGLTVVRAAAG
jgi:DNA-binding transcriptional MerR regulator